MSSGAPSRYVLTALMARGAIAFVIATAFTVDPLAPTATIRWLEIVPGTDAASAPFFSMTINGDSMAMMITSPPGARLVSDSALTLRSLDGHDHFIVLKLRTLQENPDLDVSFQAWRNGIDLPGSTDGPDGLLILMPRTSVTELRLIVVAGGTDPHPALSHLEITDLSSATRG